MMPKGLEISAVTILTPPRSVRGTRVSTCTLNPACWAAAMTWGTKAPAPANSDRRPPISGLAVPVARHADGALGGGADEIDHVQHQSFVLEQPRCVVDAFPQGALAGKDHAVRGAQRMDRLAIEF